MKRKDSLFHRLSLTLTMRYFNVLLLIFVYNSIGAQLSLNFDDGNINNVKWIGDIQNFKINTSNQLQLATTGAGESSIFTKYKVPADSIQVDLFFKMQFAPSNDNFSKIYLFIDSPQEATANGYYLKLGENGSNDAVQLYKLTDGKSTFLGAGTNGAIALEPSQARLRLKLYRNGVGILSSDYNGQQILETDMEFFDPALILPDSIYFGIYCKYTATRSDKFFYDDISIKTIEKDTIPPKVILAKALNNRDLRIVFSEQPETESATNTSNYFVDNNLGSPAEVLFNPQKPLECILRFADHSIKSNITYTLKITNIRDLSNNTTPHEIKFFFIETPDKGDLVINEVLTDPISGGEDFVELYNKSTKLLKLDSIIILNKERSESRMIRTDFVLKPGGYVAISKNPTFLKNTYQTPDSAGFIEAIIPALNVASAAIYLQYMKSGRLITIDSFDYKQSLHFSLLNNTKGVSLERINPDGPSNDSNNWHSASADKNYGTPGYKNSNFKPQLDTDNDDFVLLDQKVFTPDGDGIDDIVLIKYNMDKSGYLATIRIFDSDGFPIIDLANNLLLGQEATIKWDGLDVNGTLVKTGMYIIFSRLFHPDGNVKTRKNVIVASHKL